MTSIRRRTALLVAASMTALLVAGGAVLAVALRHALTAQFDEGLAARAAALRSLTHFDGEKVEMDFAREAMPRFATPHDDSGGDTEYFVAWVRESGRDEWRVLERSGSLAERDWPADADLSGGVRNVRLPGGTSRNGRAIVEEFTATWEGDQERAANPGSGPPRVRLLVATPRLSLDRALAAAAWSIAAVGGVMAMGSVIVSRWAVRRGLTPLLDLSAGIAAVGPTTLDARFDAASLPVELRPVAEQLSELLIRLQAAFEREKRFTSAASHELRTPIAELRMLLEVAASRPRSDAEWNVNSERALGVLDRAQSLCDALLRLSRAESGAGACRPVAAVTLAPVLAEQAARAVMLHGGDARRMRIDCPTGLTALIDPAAFATIIANLFENALRHGSVSAERPAECIARQENEGVIVIVRNHAPIVSSADVRHFFEPFWQADPSRSGREGFGMGLSVCRALAEACGGRIDAVMEDEGVLGVSVRLPVGASTEI